MVEDKSPLEQSGAYAANANSTLSPDKPSALSTVRSWLKYAFGFKNDGSLKEAIEEVLEEHGEETASLPTQEKAMLRGVLAFGDMTVRDIMIPRTDIVAVPNNKSLYQFKAYLNILEEEVAS